MKAFLSLRARAERAAKQSPRSGGDSFGRYRSLAMTVVFVMVAASAFWNTNQVWAQAGAGITSTATYEFGGQITFAAQVQPPVQVQQASIIIFDETQGVSHVRPVTFTDGRSEFLFDTQQNRVRPFSSLRWYYQLTLADGTAIQSDSFSLRYEDNRYTWQTLEAGSVRVLWARGDAAFGQNALNAALSGLQSINQIFPADLSQPIDIYIYPSQTDISFLSGEAWEAGRAYPDLGLAFVAIELDSNQTVDMERRIPHELTHVLLYRHLGAGYRNLPVWLNEGIATLAEINPTSDYERALTDASDRNALIPMRDLCASFPTDPASAFLAYAQSRSFTTYLRDTYGAPVLLNLAALYTTGVDCENGVQQAFGLSLADLDEKWREDALGQNVLGVAFRNMLPYFVLLLLVIFVPLLVGLNSMKKK